MGVEAQFQAIPEDCELLAHARVDRGIAKNLVGLEYYVNTAPLMLDIMDEEDIRFYHLIIDLVRLHPGLEQRYFYAAPRKFDAIVYLLSSARRDRDWENDHSLIYKAIYGTEQLHPKKKLSDGRPIGFVSAMNVPIVSDYLSSVTIDQLREHFDPVQMAQAGVYKIHPSDGEREWKDATFQKIWEEFVGMRDVYRAAAEHHEAMIVVID